MAKKIYCDGCDDEIRFPDEDNNVRVVIGDDTTHYDLCDDCVRKHMHPTKYERAPKPARMTNFDHD